MRVRLHCVDGTVLSLHGDPAHHIHDAFTDDGGIPHFITWSDASGGRHIINTSAIVCMDSDPSAERDVEPPYRPIPPTVESPPAVMWPFHRRGKDG